MDFAKYLKPTINEKSLAIAENGQYTFDVLSPLNKITAKNLIEKQYNVKVSAVRRINLRGKEKQVGVRRYRITSPRSKVIAQLEKGQSIADFNRYQ